LFSAAKFANRRSSMLQTSYWTRSFRRSLSPVNSKTAAAINSFFKVSLRAFIPFPLFPLTLSFLNSTVFSQIRNRLTKHFCSAKKQTGVAFCHNQSQNNMIRNKLNYFMFDFPTDQRLDHETFCAYRPVSCRFAQHGCELETSYKEIHQHHKVCSYNPDNKTTATTVSAWKDQQRMPRHFHIKWGWMF